MPQESWQRPLPPEILLGGEKSFSPPLSDPTQSWVVAGGTGSSPALGVKSRSARWPGGIQLEIECGQGSQPGSSPGAFSLPPTLDQMSWDWVGYHCRPVEALAVQVINWVPDPRVICGRHRIENTGAAPREIILRITCKSDSAEKSGRVRGETYHGRQILSGKVYGQHLALFLAGSESVPGGPANQLQATGILEPSQAAEIRWILALADSDRESRSFLEELIQLDWEGEIARRRISLANQLQIKTGRPEWDFSLAVSQRQAAVILQRLCLQADHSAEAALPLDPAQAWQLVLGLAQLDTSRLERILRSAIREEQGKVPSFPLQAELLWHAWQAGIPLEALQELLPLIDRNLASWFSASRDKDGDGVPEEPGEFLFSWGLHHQPGWEGGGDALRQDGSLETPGLAALLHNEICQLHRLQEIVPGVSRSRQGEKRALEAFILDSWDENELRFRTREFHSHGSAEGFILAELVGSGWHNLHTELPHPSRLSPQLARRLNNHPGQDLRIILHGLDWLGRSRIEELTSQDFLWQEGGGWASSQTIFSRLDYCLAAGLGRGQSLLIEAPQTDRQDLCLTLPLWMEDLPGAMREKVISSCLSEGALYRSPYGLKSIPQAESSPVQLPVNLLVNQGLVKAGRAGLAGKILAGWLDAAAVNINRDGSLYPAWDSRTGAGLGKPDQLTGILPVGQLLDLLGVRFLVDGNLVLEARSPLLFPVQLRLRGTEIILQQGETVLRRRGGERVILARGERHLVRL